MTSSPSSQLNIATLARSFLAACIARAFTPPPDIPIWRWADIKVWLQSEDAAEPGPYRSEKPPWTRRLQELARHPFMWVWDYDAARWTKVRVTEVNIQKSTQSGFTEAILNIIRWIATFLGRNVIYAIDSIDEAKKIARRLLRSLKFLDPGIFTGDPDDITKTEFILRGMELLFIGSFSPGKFANKQAWLVVSEEVEEHGQASGDTSSLRNLKYRKKTQRDGLQVNTGKPKLEGGPINKAWKRGNREEFHIRCPHCQHLQWINHRAEEIDSPFTENFVTFEDPDTGGNVTLPVPLPRGETRKIRTGRLIYDHCKDLMGNWDELRILREVFFECGQCGGRIEEHQKQSLGLEAAGRDALLGWLPTVIGTPGIVSQHMSDLLSTDQESSWGQIVLELVTAKKEGRAELMGVVNNRFGNAWREELVKTEETDILANVAGRGDLNRLCPPYRRGRIPFVPGTMLLGSDVGETYARWVLLAAMPDLENAAVIDFGEELDPESIVEIILKHTWPCDADGKKHRIAMGAVDAKFRRMEVLRCCWHVFKNGNRRLIPMSGIGGRAARGVRMWTFVPVEGYGGKGIRNKNFKRLNYNDREAKNHLYIDCLRKRNKRIFMPSDLFGKDGKPKDQEAQRFVEELCAEQLIDGPNGPMWDEEPGPNHYGDALKNAVTLLRFLTKKHFVGEHPEQGEAEPTALSVPTPFAKANRGRGD
jgi:hypothetical protein